MLNHLDCQRDGSPRLSASNEVPQFDDIGFIVVMLDHLDCQRDGSPRLSASHEVPQSMSASVALVHL